VTPRRLGAGLAGAAALIAVITVVSRVVGFGRWLVFSGSVGATCVGQAYSTANQLPNVLFEVVAGGALAGAVIPLLAGPLARVAEAGAGGKAAAAVVESHRREVDRTASALLTWTVLVLLPLSVVVALLADPLIGLLLGREGCAGQTQLAVRMLVVFAPQVVLYGIGVVLTGVLQAHHRFAWPAVAPLLSSLVVIGAYRAYAATSAGAREVERLPSSAEAWLAWGTTAGVAVMTLPLLVPVLRCGVRLRPTVTFPAGVARRAGRLAAAGIAALLAQQASVLAVVKISNTAGTTGTLNVFQYTQAVYLLPYAVLAVPLATAAFPRLASHAATGDRKGYASTSSTTTRAVLLVSLAGAAVLVATAWPVGAFFGVIDDGSVVGMGAALVAIAPGLVGFALIAHLGRALYALERGRDAAMATVAGWVAVVLAMVGGGLLARSRDDVVVWLGAGSSVGMTVAGALLLVALRRVAGAAAVAGVGRTLVGTGAAALLGGAGGWWVGARLVELWEGDVVRLVLAGVVSAACAIAVVVAGIVLLDRSSAQAARRLVAGAAGSRRTT
jgi:putative peptidoglycan lipid II flippase